MHSRHLQDTDVTCQTQSEKHGRFGRDLDGAGLWNWDWNRGRICRFRGRVLKIWGRTPNLGQTVMIWGGCREVRAKRKPGKRKKRKKLSILMTGGGKTACATFVSSAPYLHKCTLPYKTGNSFTLFSLHICFSNTCVKLVTYPHSHSATDSRTPQNVTKLSHNMYIVIYVTICNESTLQYVT